MRLYLIRHAVASDRDVLRWPDDRERPLSDRGKKKFARAAQGLREVADDVEVVLSSPLVRAWQTAEIAHAKARWPEPIACEELANPSATAVLEALRPYSGAAAVALVGHEPNLHLLAGFLLHGYEQMTPFELGKGSAARIDFNGAPEASAGRLRWLLSQRLLRSLA